MLVRPVRPSAESEAELQAITPEQRREHFDASIGLEPDDLTPSQCELLEVQNWRVVAREARLRSRLRDRPTRGPCPSRVLHPPR